MISVAVLTMSLTRKTISAFKWSVFGEIASRAIGPVVFLVLARLLVPSDFGVMAASMVVISFSQALSEAGLVKALIQCRDRVEESANAVFWLSLGFGLLVVVLLFLSAPIIAGFFHDERIAPVVQVQSLQIFLSAFSSTHTALLQKELNFKSLFGVRLATTAAPGLASIPLAMHGMGYWALVFGSLLGQAAQSVVLWRCSRWRPHWGWDRSRVMELMAFGKWAMLSALLGWFYGWMDTIIIGHYLGPHDMGLYRTGNTFVTLIFGLIFSPLLPVLYSAFSRLQHDPNKVGRSLLLAVKGIAIVAFPVSTAIITMRGPIEELIFGGEWNGIGTVIALLALSQGLAWLVGSNGEAYRGVGKPHIETWAMVLSVAAYFIGYVVSACYGLLIFLLTRLALVFFGLLCQLIVSKVVFQLRLADFVRAGYKSFIISFGMLGLLNIFATPSGEGWIAGVCKGAAGLLLCAGLVAMAERDYIARMKTLLRADSTLGT